jgi:hypothetical protein
MEFRSDDDKYFIRVTTPDRDVAFPVTSELEIRTLAMK